MSGAYVANKGTRLNSQTLPINALSPSLLAVGQKLDLHSQPLCLCRIPVGFNK